MTMTKYFVSLITLLMLFSVPVRAEEINWVEKEGVIYKIDRGNRTAIIGGYRYYFGSASGYQNADMDLIGFPGGSFELLETGMIVQFHFVQEDPWRRIIRLRQLPDDTWPDKDLVIPKPGNQNLYINK